ncbi:hypothetical protein EDM57_05080 [Brevibacillus gelatini]|uniref:DUF2508 family protein n=1 Tax=Brevibacillus gelatini TaxID=1655277 RepID=A0A3M8B7U9_9BACL|nr:hypothetical protein [Brevibacillus gelatini]RNB59516.1 hypothetical protein EDM57_05080 [Brevibacillus gelatini]
MNHIQTAYLKMKAAYNQAFAAENWDLVEQLEDEYIEAEIALVNWAIDQAVNTGLMSQEEEKNLRTRWVLESYRDKIISLALRMSA